MTMSQQHQRSPSKDSTAEEKPVSVPDEEGVAGVGAESTSQTQMAESASLLDEQNGNDTSGSRAATPDILNDVTLSASSSTSNLTRGGVRNTSSKFASLRATFEHRPLAHRNPSADGEQKRRQDKGAGKNQDYREYEVEIARMKDELEKEKDLRVAFEEKTTNLEDEIDELNAALEAREELWRGENERLGMKLKSEAEDRLNAMAMEARSRQNDTTNLHRQLAEMKRNVSTSTRASMQVSDTTFRQEIGVLQHEVQNWVVHNFRRVKIEASPDELCEKLESATEEKQLARLKPIYKEFDLAAKLPIYQATVSCYLMEIFEEPYLFGVQGQLDWGTRLRRVADSLQSIFEPETYHRWRAMTFEALRQSECIKEPVESAASGISEMICITLEAVTDVEDSETRLPSLKAIIQRAISLAHLIRVQRAQYEFTLPSPRELFDSSSMDDVSDAADTESACPIRCATFPALIKTGDDDGDELELINVVVKAKVLCGEAEG